MLLISSGLHSSAAAVGGPDLYSHHTEPTAPVAATAAMFRATAMENVCFRCKKTVYPTDKIGPLKDFTFFHSGCFRCLVCNCKLTLKTYYNNQHSGEDKEVYCSAHVPKTGPGHFDTESVGIKSAMNAPKQAMHGNEQIRPGGKAHFDADALAIRAQMSRTHLFEKGANGNEQGEESGGAAGPSKHPNAKNWGRYDSSALHIQHALKQTEVQRKYSKPYQQPIEVYLVSNKNVDINITEAIKRRFLSRIARSKSVWRTSTARRRTGCTASSLSSASASRRR